MTSVFDREALAELSAERAGGGAPTPMSVPNPVDPNPRIAEPVDQALASYPIEVHAGSGAVAAYRHDHVERLVTSGPAGGGSNTEW